MAERRSAAPGRRLRSPSLVAPRARRRAARGAAPAARRRRARRSTTSTVEPSTTQAGGHPDIDVDRLDRQPLHTEHIPAAAATARTRGTSSSTCRPGVIGDPHATAAVHARRVRGRRLPGRVPDRARRRSASTTNIRAPKASAAYSPIYNLEPHPDEAGLLGFHVPLLELADLRQSINARTESDYGLDVRQLEDHHPCPAARLRRSAPLGSPGATRATTSSRLAGRAANPLRTNGDTNAAERPVERAADSPSSSNPTTCGEPARRHASTSPSYDREVDHATAPCPGDDRLRPAQLQPEPLRASRPTTEADTASGLDVDLKVPQAQSPTTSRRRRRSAATDGDPAGRASRSTRTPPTARPPAPTRRRDSAPGEAAQCPEFSKVGTLTLDSSALPGPIPGRHLPRRAASPATATG